MTGLDRYYLGSDPGWLWRPPAGLPAGVGLFVSHTRLARGGRDYDPRPMRAAAVGWALDSGGFTELDRHGRYSYQSAEYVWSVRRYDAEIGRLEWAAPMDWMCEPEQVERTGLSVAEHQERTVVNFLDLCELWWELEDVAVGARLGVPGWQGERNPELCPFMPVLQGYGSVASYLRCVELYERAGVDLGRYPVVGVGSVCRLSNTRHGVGLLRQLGRELESRYPGGPHYPAGVGLHAFGVSASVLARLGGVVATADSRAWSMGGRLRGGRCQHGDGIVWEQNCPRYAVEQITRVLAGPAQRDRGPGVVDLFTEAGLEW